MSFLGEVTYTGKRNLRCFGNFLLINMKGNKVMVEKTDFRIKLRTKLCDFRPITEHFYVLISTSVREKY